jgi:hypothetical protein
VTAVRAIALPAAPASASLELDDEFFSNEGAALEPLEVDEERENPVLSPAQYRRRLQLRRQVAALVVGLSLFALLALWLRFGG